MDVKTEIYKLKEKLSSSKDSKVKEVKFFKFCKKFVSYLFFPGRSEFAKAKKIANRLRLVAGMTDFQNFSVVFFIF